MTALALILLCAAPASHTQQSGRQSEAGSSPYYRKWLEEDALWIISEEEREVFLSLGADEERDAFIEQFWARRDPDPATPENEFKMEHYWRVVYANENFSAGIAGWKSDRGMVYIKFGPPDRKETNPGGGPYARERKEGGGMTAAFPFERWEYRRIEGIGDDVELEFVDDKGGGLYELTWDRRRKDALLLSGRMGLTQDELEQLSATGIVNKRDRILGKRESGELTGIYKAQGGFESTKDKPFEQLRISSGIYRPPAVKFKDLEAAVSARVTYSGVAFDVRSDFIRITDQQVLVPITLLISNDQLTFRDAGGVRRGTVQVFGRVTTLGNRIETVFEDEVSRDLPPAEFERVRHHASMHQRRLILKPGLYKLDVAVKDTQGDRIGILERRLEVPRFAEDELQLSSLILAERIETSSQDRLESSFILGDLKVVPRVDDVFRASGSLGLYAQVYGFAIDEQTRRPSLKAEYGIAGKDGEPAVWRDIGGSVQYAGSYSRIARMISLSRLQPGEYTLRVRVRDAVSGRHCAGQADFKVVP